MKIIGVILLLFSMTNSFGKEVAKGPVATCQERATLFVLFKIKDKVIGRMVGNGVSKTAPYKCDLLKDSEFNDIQKKREELEKKCDSGEQIEDFINPKDKSLKELIVASGGNESECLNDYMATEMSRVVNGIKTVKDVRAICNVFSPFNEGLYKKANYCDQIKKARKEDPFSCEIPDANGRCPGAPETQTGQSKEEGSSSPTAPKNQKPGLIDWSKIKKKGARGL